jgi:hypothetical protein
VDIAPKISLPVVQSAPPTAFADHVRNRFESIERQHELASELDCFRPGHELASIRFIANAHSVHVARWLTLLSHTKTKIEIQTANPIPAFSNEYMSARSLLPGWVRLPMVVRYLLSGLILRFTGSRSKSTLVHAHCASGNGFVAWLSGQPYVIGAYGTEIFGSNQRSFAYRWLLRKILQGADRIQVGSPECTKILCEEYNIPAERIYCFHNGLDERTFHSVSDQRRMQLRRDAGLPVDEPIWIVNRRTHPHYRTQEVVDGFLKYCQTGGKGRLVLLCGDHQPDYTKAICEMAQSHPEGSRITVVERILSHTEVATWLQLGDFSISVPKTDMFSVSTYESLGCGCVPIVSNLDAYNPLRFCNSVRWMTQFQPNDFTNTFIETAKAWPTPHDASRKDCLRFAQEGFSSENAIRDIAAFYMGAPPCEDRLAKWAA